MLNATKLIVLTFVFLVPTFATAGSCDSLVSASIRQAMEYIDHANDTEDAANCVKIAFHQIAQAPTEQAVSALVKYLAYKRPLTGSERSGFFMHGKTPETIYPAVQELYQIGDPAVPNLIAFIGKQTVSKDTATQNALYTLVLIHHGDGVGVIQRLHAASISSSDTATRDRLQDAARSAMKWCDKRWKSKCEEALD